MGVPPRVEPHRVSHQLIPRLPRVLSHLPHIHIRHFYLRPPVSYMINLFVKPGVLLLNNVTFDPMATESGVYRLISPLKPSELQLRIGVEIQLLV